MCRSTSRAILFLLSIASPSAVVAQEALHDPAARPEVLVLGVYHMGSAGDHVFDSEADDILSAKRQAEIEELLDVLERFRPTRIAVEAAFHDGDVIAGRYEAWLRGERTVTRNETEQIGFRLARRLGHETVYAVDANWAGPDLVADWVRRNMRIYGNILQLIDSPDERVLVVFGGGHLGWLRHDFATDPDVRLRTLAEIALQARRPEGGGSMAIRTEQKPDL